MTSIPPHEISHLKAIEEASPIATAANNTRARCSEHNSYAIFCAKSKLLKRWMNNEDNPTLSNVNNENFLPILKKANAKIGILSAKYKIDCIVDTLMFAPHNCVIIHMTCEIPPTPPVVIAELASVPVSVTYMDGATKQ